MYPQSTYPMYLLELGGRPVGRLISIEGPTIKSNIITPPISGGGSPLKQIGDAVPSNIKIQFGTGMSRTFYEWIASDNPTRKDGAIIAVDSKISEVSRIEFANAFVTSFLSPKLDRESKSPSSFMASIQPEQVRFLKGGGKANVSGYIPGPSKQWLLSDFRVIISGLEAESSTITQIEPFGLTQRSTTNFVGSSRYPEFVPTSGTYSNLAVTLPFSNSVLESSKSIGNRVTESIGQTGLLEYSGPNQKLTYFSVEFSNLMISQVSVPNTGEISKQSMRVEMSFSSMKFSAQSSAIL
jgi:T4-like virus tail tube protein gp19.